MKRTIRIQISEEELEALELVVECDQEDVEEDFDFIRSSIEVVLRLRAAFEKGRRKG